MKACALVLVVATACTDSTLDPVGRFTLHSVEGKLPFVYEASSTYGVIYAGGAMVVNADGTFRDSLIWHSCTGQSPFFDCLAPDTTNDGGTWTLDRGTLRLAYTGGTKCPFHVAACEKHVVSAQVDGPNLIFWRDDAFRAVYLRN